MEKTEPGHCACGHAIFQIKGAPILRGYCHCTICQKYNNAPFGDITVYRAKDVTLPLEASVEYTSYRQPSFLKRGVCVSCRSPAVETLNICSMLKLVIVPTANISNSDHLITPSLHIFYDKRTADIEDGLPKFQGYFASQTGFLKALMKAKKG